MPHRSQHHRAHRPQGHRRRSLERGAIVAAAAALLVVALVASGCGPQPTAVCSGRPADFVLIPSTSKTDDETSVAMTPEVSKEVIRRVAESCGRVTVGIQNGRPEANLVLHSTTLIPEDQTAYNTRAKTKKLVEKGDEFVHAELIGPLDQTAATGGSPFFSTLIKVGEEMTAHNWEPGMIVLVGDGLVVERPPGGGKMIRFGIEQVPNRTVESFVPMLKSLRGSCVVLVGAGADSKLPDDRLRASQKMFGQTLEAAGVGFVSTRSPDLPEGC
jgi:hypothetical protein